MLTRWMTSLAAIAIIAALAFTGVEPVQLPSAASNATVVATDTESAHGRTWCRASSRYTMFWNMRHERKPFYSHGHWWTEIRHTPTSINWWGEPHTQVSRCTFEQLARSIRDI